MENSFFNTHEYNTLKKICSRLEDKVTLKNVILYWKYSCECLTLVKKYDDVGYDEETKSYKWWPRFFIAREEYDLKECQELIEKFGDDYEKMILYLNRKL